MMNYGDILARAWKIVWNNKYMFLLGFFAALGNGGNIAGNNFTFTFGGNDIPPDFATRTEAFLTQYWATSLGLTCLVLVVAVVFWLIRLTAQAGLISAASRIDAGEKVSFGEAVTAGVSKLGRMLGINILMYGPFLIIGFFVAAIGVAVLAATITGEVGGLNNDIGELVGSLGVFLICVTLAFCIIVPFLLVVSVLYPFAQRGAVLQDLGVIESIRHGYRMVVANLGEVILLVLLFIVLGIAVGLVSAVILVPLAFLAFVPAFLSAVTSGTLDFGNIALIACGGVCIGLVAAAIRAVFVAFRSSAVTFAYQEFLAKS
jgi:hypothetical protein